MAIQHSEPQGEQVHTFDVRDLPVAAFAVDESHHVVAWNDAAERLLGYAAEDAIGQRCYDVLSAGEHGEGLLCRSHCALLTRNGRRGAPTVEVLLETQSGATKRFKLSLVATHAPSGRTRVLHVLVDPFERHPLVHVGSSSTREDDPLEHEFSADPVLAAGDAPAVSAQHLSARELEVLGLLAQGFTPAQIAARLGISRVTVRNHLTHTMDKLAVKTRLRAVIVASHLGLIS